ncbi:hypothetical protein MT341_01630 [Staphylococcus sp. NRL 18/288]|nr:hypothetical protein [Staphylococcus sp. NRL 18/288]MCJ1661298.1 hypothetical protein [Staphylococcus sp. NRL 18/288]
MSSCFAYYHFFLKGNEQAQNKPATTQHVSKEEEKQGEHRISNDPKKAEKQREEEEKTDKADKENAPQPPKIDVLSDGFQTTYMQQNNLDSFMGIKVGMSRDEVEKRFGKGKLMPHITGFDDDYIKYGNIAIIYNPRTQDNTVWGIAVAPDNVSEQEFIRKYNTYDQHTGSGAYIYNNVKNNGFEILVTPVNGKVALVECIPEY